MLILGLSGPAAWADDWPPLPKQGFITGRAAQAADVQNGDAVFVAAVDGHVIGRPMAVQIPQYVTVKGPPRVKGVLVQAEEAQGVAMYGILTADGQSLVTLSSEVELLGTKRPR
ncbi:hypothetical protein BWR60_20255 [Inquilinus limosus]|uniref:Uncharacterized protein n=1 Tax=Inquilinus limosus TaxID=171674 RepID=A0A211ZJ59_9PROT|nr:hypothetical protein BWR60_20255 [Inquilinus limosus]